MLPACGMETTTDKKPDHVAIKMEFRLLLVSQGYQGQRRYEEAKTTNPLDVAVAYQQQRDLHKASWIAALLRGDVDELWNLWCWASESALGLPATSRGQLLLGN
eukprot:4580301-Amphidinium_carterae.3